MFEELNKNGEANELSKEQRLELLMNQFGRDVVRLAFTYTKEKQLAEDIAQEVFIRCYQNLDVFRHESSYKTWVFRITINLCRDYFRSWNYKHITISDIFNKLSFTNRTPETEYMNLEKNRVIGEKVLALPLKYREVIILYYYEEMSYNQISKLLNMSQQTIKSRLHRARLKLQKSLEKGELDESYI
ncbi:RNA polymerase subunit sigma [Ornithinibacillus bavariensis]|uniref:RNA polymerase subunit sigma n=2 Tax=Ornithinibacillus bavariensis TaxID=545502 RepID=A0A919XC58_9BACI|nr:RNA polymerase subunit sigma [Ornithinibacillus bavariensis]